MLLILQTNCLRRLVDLLLEPRRGHIVFSQYHLTAGKGMKMRVGEI